MGELISQIEENHIKMQKLAEQTGGNRFKKNEELAKAKIAAVAQVAKLQDQVALEELDLCISHCGNLLLGFATLAQDESCIIICDLEGSFKISQVKTI